jgi:hypothetical protein
MPTRPPHTHRANHQSRIAADRAKEAAGGREAEAGPELPKPTVAPKIAAESVAPRYIDSDEEEDPAMDLDQPETAVSLANDLSETPEKKVEVVIDLPILYGVWKTDDLPPHLVKYFGDELKLVYSAYNSALFRRGLEADKLVTHAPAVRRGKLKDSARPEVDNIPIDIQRAEMYDMFGEWAMSYGGTESFPVNGPPTHPDVVVADYKTRINRFLASLTAPIYKNLSNRVAKLLKLDEEIAISLQHFRTDSFDIKKVKAKALAAYAPQFHSAFLRWKAVGAHPSTPFLEWSKYDSESWASLSLSGPHLPPKIS